VSVHEDSPDGQGGGAGHQRIVVDSKAMRKFGPEDVVIYVLEVILLGTAAMNVHADARMLFKV